MEDKDPALNYVYSSSLDVDVIIKIGSLDNFKFTPDYTTMLKDEMIGYTGLYQQNKLADLMVVCQVFGDGHPLTTPISTSYKSFEKFWNWNEWVTLPIKFNDLPRNALLSLTIYDCYGPDKVKPVGGTTISFFGKYGLFRQGLLDLYVWPDVIADVHHNKTPGKLKIPKSRMQSLYRLMRKHKNNVIPKIDWLDRLSFREMELICDSDKKINNEFYLMIEFPYICYNGNSLSVIYHEDESQSVYQFNPFRDINAVLDSEILKENLVEDKHHKLYRSIRNRVPDKDAKPNSEVRDLLKNIITYSPMRFLTAEEQDLVWKYRFYLSDQKKALVKFLNCVNWNLGIEVQQALDLMSKWSPVDVDEGLQLLTPAFKHPAVRQYAVNCLKQTSDDNLMLYFLQLVQALKYEDIDSFFCIFDEMQVLIANEGSDITRTNFLLQLLQKSKIFCTDLLSFLICRSCNNIKLANYFFWYVIVEYENHTYAVGPDKISEMYIKVMTLFMQTLKYGNDEFQSKHIMLLNQQLFLDSLVELVKIIMKENGNRTKKITKLQSLLAESDLFKIKFSNFEQIPFPLDPDVIIKGIVPEKATLFKSKLMPSRLTFITSDNTEYVAIFKYGDDLRQDQLVLQIISLIDNLLKREKLDLKLTPYKVLATSTKHGFVQYINSYAIAEILSEYSSLQTFFKKHHPSKSAAYGISLEVMDTYVKSCAGYCVITYLLGVGDRHLDNLMISSNGNLFHIDFGYILGRDPKPLPPPLKLSKEMVEAMGGVNSEHYNEFKKHCFNAFLFLRRHADLILNIFSLMVDANIPDIALEPDKAVKKIEDKLCLNLGDEEAVQHFKIILDSSVADIMAVIVDHLHKFTQYCRN